MKDLADKKILVTHSYFYKLDQKQWKMAEPYPPLMTLIAAACLRNSGFHVRLFDAALKDSPEELRPELTAFDPDYLVIFDDGFNYLTKMCLTVMREAAFSMQKLASEYGAKVIVCSSDSTDHFEKYLDHQADFVLCGEGEQTLIELLLTLENKEDVSQVAGLAYRSGDNKTVITPGRAVIRDLDSLPLPAWDLVDIKPYQKRWAKKSSSQYLNIATTRGCPYKCNWCAKPIYGNRYHSRSPQHVVHELEEIIARFDINHFWMCDDIFGLKPGWIQQFRDEVKARNLDIRYKIQSRVDLLLKEDTLDAAAASGLDEVWLGAESGSQHILDAMDKGTKVEQIYEATIKLKRKGIKVGFFIQFGYPGETTKDVKATIDMVLDLMPDSLGISVSYPLPGTKFYENVKKEMGLKANWTNSNDLDPMFKNTYPARYYKLLHQYLHAVYRLKKNKSLLLNKPFFFLVSLKNPVKHFWLFMKKAWLGYQLNTIEKSVANSL